MHHFLALTVAAFIVAVYCMIIVAERLRHHEACQPKDDHREP